MITQENRVNKDNKTMYKMTKRKQVKLQRYINLTYLEKGYSKILFPSIKTLSPLNSKLNEEFNKAQQKIN